MSFINAPAYFIYLDKSSFQNVFFYFCTQKYNFTLQGKAKRFNQQSSTDMKNLKPLFQVKSVQHMACKRTQSEMRYVQIVRSNDMNPYQDTHFKVAKQVVFAVKNEVKYTNRNQTGHEITSFGGHQYTFSPRT